METAITALAYSLPERILDSDDIRLRFGVKTADKISALSGILQRRCAAESECASDFACSAAKLLFEKTAVSPNDIDLLIFATQTPDYMLPSSSCILQDRLGIPKSCAAFDINLGCSQFVYSLATAKAWIGASLARRALVLCGDTPTRLINPLDRSAVSIFGDAGCAALVEKSEKPSLLNFSFGTDGAGFDDIIAPVSGMRRRATPMDFNVKPDADGNMRSEANLRVNGFRVFNFAYKTVPESVEQTLKKNSLKKDDIDLFIFHQAGEKIVSSVADRLKIDCAKVYYKMHDIGNCGGSSIAIAMADAVLKGRLCAGMKVLVSAFGVGRSWGSAVLDWSGNFRGAFTDADFSKSPSKPLSQCAAD